MSVSKSWHTLYSLHNAHEYTNNKADASPKQQSPFLSEETETHVSATRPLTPMRGKLTEGREGGASKLIVLIHVRAIDKCLGDSFIILQCSQAAMSSHLHLPSPIKITVAQMCVQGPGLSLYCIAMQNRTSRSTANGQQHLFDGHTRACAHGHAFAKWAQTCMHAHISTSYF